MRTYEEFLQTKIAVAKPVTPELENATLPEGLFDHQQAMSRWMLKNGRGLLAASFGLGKTRVQTAVAKVLVEHYDLPFLVVAPLGVRHQFQQEDGPAMGVEWQYVRTDEEIQNATSKYLITNYERVRDGGINPQNLKLAGASLDEGSVLRSMGSKTSNVFNDAFEGVAHRYVCTATPSPNNFREIIYYAHFLGVMDKSQILTRFFMRNVDKAGDLQINPEHEESFWLWVASWALFLHTPSDLGFSDEGYVLPELRVHWHCIDVAYGERHEIDNRGQGVMFGDSDRNVSHIAREARLTLEPRLKRAAEILGSYTDGEHTILWHQLEAERKLIEQRLPQYTAVYGSQSLEEQEKIVIGFAHGEIPHLACKEMMLGSGCNFQRHCHVNIFLGPTYKFQDFIQAIHRTQRFQQTHPVDVHIIYAESQQHMVRAMKTKWAQHNELTARMRTMIQEYGLSHEAIAGGLTRKIGVEREVWEGISATLVHNDTVREMPQMEENSVGLVLTSVPFGNQYEYGTNVEDFGYNETNERYHEQMDFLIPQLLRVLKPGRVACIHVKDRIRYGWQTKSNIMEVEPFSDDTVAAFRRHGFMYEGRRTIVTDVVRENNSTYRLSYSEMVKDASKMGGGLPEYLLLFRKPPTDTSTAYADEKIVKDKSAYSLARWQIDASSFWRSNGDSSYEYEEHVKRLEQKEALGTLPTTYCGDPALSVNPDVWTDVNFMQCLNNRQAEMRRTKHLCPLPIDIVKRCIRLYSNEGDLVLDPFSGLGTVAYCAVMLHRQGYGVELNPDYFKDSVGYLKEIEAEMSQPTLFEVRQAA